MSKKLLKPKFRLNKKSLKLIEEIFKQKLSSKTCWGRNEIATLYKEAVNEALLTLMDDQND